MIEPFTVVDVETTGIPGKIKGWEPRVVEVGYCTFDGYKLASDARLVWQPNEHLLDERAAEALRIIEIDPGDIAIQGKLDHEAATWLRGHGRLPLRAFNQSFDRGFLRTKPWRIPDSWWGECIMLAVMEVMGPAGALPPAPAWVRKKDLEQLWKWPRVGEALAFFNAKGYPIKWNEQAHRAEQDAVKECQIAIAVECERHGLEWPLKGGDA